MKRAVGLVLLGLVLLFFGFWLKGQIEQPDPAYCEATLRQAYERGATLATRPAACDGIDEATLEQIVGRILQDAPAPGLR